MQLAVRFAGIGVAGAATYFTGVVVQAVRDIATNRNDSAGRACHLGFVHHADFVAGVSGLLLFTFDSCGDGVELLGLLNLFGDDGLLAGYLG